MPPGLHIATAQETVAANDEFATCDATARTYGGGSVTLNPGTYSTINVGGSDAVVLNPGVYTITSGVHLSGTASMTGTGAVIFLNSGAGIQVDAGATFNVQPPTSGTFNGFTVFSARTNTADINFTGAASR